MKDKHNQHIFHYNTVLILLHCICSDKSYHARVLLAALDYNNHLDQQPQEEEQDKKNCRLYRKGTKWWDVFPVTRPKQYGYIAELVQRVFEERATSTDAIRTSLPGKRKSTICGEGSPLTTSLVSSKKSRFSSN